jgi:2-polyprenyl-6-methoxyphenol hydroxylase-like FAD-dependent oxidoreductase
MKGKVKRLILIVKILINLGIWFQIIKFVKVCMKKLKTLKNVEIITETEVKSVKNLESEIIIDLKNRQITTKLLVAADSRFSTLRRQVGINTQMRDFAKTMIVVNMHISKPHNGVALERF